MKLANFSIKKTEKVEIQTNHLRKFIDKKVKEKNFSSLISNTSSGLFIPRQHIEFEFKRLLSYHHDFRIGRFEKLLSIYNLPLYIALYFLSLFFLLFFSKRVSSEKEKVDIILDNVISTEEAIRTQHILKKFKSYKILCNTDLGNKFNFIQYKNKNCSREFLKKIFFFCVFKLFITTLKYSLKEKANLFPILITIIRKVVKYETIFNKVSADYLIEEKPYATSAIKNFLFKKYGGKKTVTTQRIIFHLGKTSFYIDTDLLLSLGKKTSDILNITGSRINKIEPVGSSIFYSKWINEKKI